MRAVRGGQVRVLAIGTAGGRIPALPDVPTAREAGVEFPFSYWYGLFGPKGLDPAVAARLLGAVRAVNAMPEVQARFAEQGGVPRGEDGVALARLLAEDLERWTALIRAKGITP